MGSKLKSLLKTLSERIEKNLRKQFYFTRNSIEVYTEVPLRLADVFVYLFFDFRFLNFDRIGDVTMILHELNCTLL